MQDLKILLVLIGILLAPLFKGKRGSNIFIIGVIIVVLSFLLLTSGCTHLALVPIIGPSAIFI
jgi:lipopolysaccharide export LptBFGC system permease protein LptF